MGVRAATALRSEVAVPTLEAVIAAIRALVPMLRERAAGVARDRRVSAEVVQAIRDTGALSVFQPRRYGGQEAGYDLFSRVTEELAAGCASTAWTYSVLAEHSWTIASFPQQAQDEVWGATPQALASSSFQPQPVERVEGGIRATGLWSFSSGCDHANWACLGGAVPGGPVLMLVPMTDIEIIDDWHVLGLRGTGSRSLRLGDVFVPDHRIVPLDRLVRGDTPGSDVHPDYWLLRAPRGLLAGYSLSPVVVGQAQRALDIVTAMFRDRGAALSPGEADSAGLTLAEASAAIDHARERIRGGAARDSDRVRHGEAISHGDILINMRDMVFHMRRLRDVVLDLCDISGTRWLYDGQPLQLILTDVIAATNHRQSKWTAGMRPYGRHLLGLDG